MSQENAFISQFGSSGGGGGAGLQGVQGTQGLQGNFGTQGSTGSGSQGVQGLQGIQGVQGNLGTQGSTGSGSQGVQGVQGVQGLQGEIGLQGLQGQVGLQGSTGAGTQGVQGVQGVQGEIGLQGSTGAGIQGLQGVQGVQGEIGLQGSTGAGIQGVQGVQGVQGEIGLQGSTGAGIQGVQGVQGVQGLQGNDGLQGSTGAGIQGSTGANGLQGVQGLQGLMGTNGAGGAVGYYGSFYSTQDQTATAINTEQKVTFNTTSLSNGISIASASKIVFANRGKYALNFSLQLEKASSGGGDNFYVWLCKNNTAIPDTSTHYVVQSNYQFVVASLDFLLDLNDGDYIEICWSVDSLNITLHYDAGVAPYPAIPSAIVNAFQVTYAVQGTQGVQGIQGNDGLQGSTGAGTQGVQGVQGTDGVQGLQGLQGVQGLQGTQTFKDANIQLQWTTGYVNLTNGVDNPIPFNSAVFTTGSDLSSSNLSTTNAGVLINSTGVYLVTCRSHFFDLGSNMILTTGLRSSTDGTTWAFLTFNNRARYEGTNTNQIQDSSFILRVTSVPFYIQMYCNPSANAPFPADLGAPSTMGVTRVGN